MNSRGGVCATHSCTSRLSPFVGGPGCGTGGSWCQVCGQSTSNGVGDDTQRYRWGWCLWYGNSDFCRIHLGWVDVIRICCVNQMVTEGGGGSIACGRFSFVHGLKAGDDRIGKKMGDPINVDTSGLIFCEASNYSVGPGPPPSNNHQAGLLHDQWGIPVTYISHCYWEGATPEPFATFAVAIAPTLELQGPCISIDVEGASSLVAVNYARCNCLKWQSNRPDHQTVVKQWPTWFIRIHQQLTLEMLIPQFVTCYPFPKPIGKNPHPPPKKIPPFLVVFWPRVVAPVPISHGSEIGIRFRLLCATPGTCNWAQREELSFAKNLQGKTGAERKGQRQVLFLLHGQLEEIMRKLIELVCSCLFTPSSN